MRAARADRTPVHHPDSAVCTRNKRRNRNTARATAAHDSARGVALVSSDMALTRACHCAPGCLTASSQVHVRKRISDVRCDVFMPPLCVWVSLINRVSRSEPLCSKPPPVLMCPSHPAIHRHSARSCMEPCCLMNACIRRLSWPISLYQYISISIYLYIYTSFAEMQGMITARARRIT